MMKHLKSSYVNQSGFTLLEILVAIAIGSIIMLMISSAHRNVIKRVKDLTAIAEYHENLNLAIRRMDRDIECIMLNPSSTKAVFSGSNNENEPKNGTITIVTINSRSQIITGGLNENPMDTDIKTVSYFLKKDPDYQGLYFLIRSERNLYRPERLLDDDDQSNESNSDNEDTTPSFESVILENVVDISFEFTEDRQWNYRWESKTPPKAIRTKLHVKTYKGKDEIFTFISTPATFFGKKS